jgi:ABC-type multidrug transport system fused ATPase/permease subunit
LDLVRQLDRVLLMDQGAVVADGAADQAIGAYTDLIEVG